MGPTYTTTGSEGHESKRLTVRPQTGSFVVNPAPDIPLTHESAGTYGSKPKGLWSI